VRIWDAYTGERQAVLAHDYYVRTVAFSPDGHLLATASTPAKIWDAHADTELVNLSPEPGPLGRLCHDVAFSQDGCFLAAGYSDHTARIWDTYTGTELLKLTHDHEVYAVAFSPDGQWFATSDGQFQATGRDPGTVHVWQLKET
jgi:WD40 repeat protein